MFSLIDFSKPQKQSALESSIPR